VVADGDAQDRDAVEERERNQVTPRQEPVPRSPGRDPEREERHHGEQDDRDLGQPLVLDGLMSVGDWTIGARLCAHPVAS